MMLVALLALATLGLILVVLLFRRPQKENFDPHASVSAVDPMKEMEYFNQRGFT